VTIEGPVGTAATPEPRISIDYRPGRWGKTFHIFDADNREIVLKEKDATYIAKSILKIAKGEE